MLFKFSICWSICDVLRPDYKDGGQHLSSFVPSVWPPLTSKGSDIVWVVLPVEKSRFCRARKHPTNGYPLLELLPAKTHSGRVANYIGRTISIALKSSPLPHQYFCRIRVCSQGSCLLQAESSFWLLENTLRMSDWITGNSAANRSSFLPDNEHM